MSQPTDSKGKPIYENDRVVLAGSKPPLRLGIVLRIGAMTGTLAVRFVGDASDTILASDSVTVQS